MKETFKPSRRKFLKLLGLGAGVVVADIVAGPLLIGKSSRLSERSLLSGQSNLFGSSNSDYSDPSLTKKFEHRESGLSFSYPSSYRLKSFNERGGGKTFVFEDVEGFNGFQLFVVPHYKDHITEERMSLDIPSGVVRATEKKKVGVNKDISAVSFYSEDKSIGETFEGWLIRDKYIFEFTTYGDLSDVLDRVFSTLEYKKMMV